jgi:hypothetical protein
MMGSFGKFAKLEDVVFWAVLVEVRLRGSVKKVGLGW